VRASSVEWRAGNTFERFQEHQEFQEHQGFQSFQEIATHFKSISRGSKGHQEFQEHVSRVTDDTRLKHSIHIYLTML